MTVGLSRFGSRSGLAPALIVEPPPDHGVRILPARAHASLELLDRRRQDEDADAAGIELAHLLRALPVDLENEVVAALHRIENHLLPRAVVIAVDLRALEEFTARLHLEKRRLVDEVVIDAVL